MSLNFLAYISHLLSSCQDMANIFEKWMDAGVANCDQIAARPQKNDMVGYD